MQATVTPGKKLKQASRNLTQEIDTGAVRSTISAAIAAGAGPEAESCSESAIRAEALFGIHEDAVVQVGSTLREALQDERQHEHADASVDYAMSAPKPPGAPANLRGSEKMPAPTIEPTTSAISAGRASVSDFSFDMVAVPSGGWCRTGVLARRRGFGEKPSH